MILDYVHGVCVGGFSVSNGGLDSDRAVKPKSLLLLGPPGLFASP